MGSFLIFLVIAILRFLYAQRTKKRSKVSSDDLTQRFNRYTNLRELSAEYSRLLLLNESNPEAIDAIHEIYLAAKEKFQSKEGRQHTNKGAKFRSLKEKNEKIFSNISTLEELKKKYRKLSHANHPDHGGSPAAMKRLNELYEQALERISSS